MNELFPAKAIMDYLCIVLFIVAVSIAAFVILFIGGPDRGFVLIVCVAVVMMYILMYVLYRACVRDNYCMFDDNMLSIGRLLFTQRIPYYAITKVQEHSNTTGSNDPNSIWISYRKTLTDFWLFGYLPLMMTIENKDRVLEILKEKCNETVFN